MLIRRVGFDVGIGVGHDAGLGGELTGLDIGLDLCPLRDMTSSWTH